MDMDLIITLLTIAVVLLSAVIIALLVVVIVVLVKLRQLSKNVNVLITNASAAAAWLAPAKVFSEAARAFRKNK